MFFVRQDTGVLEVEFSGGLTPGFVERLRALVETSGIVERGIVFDMGRLTLDDPEALWELVSFLSELDGRGIPVHIRRVEPGLRALLTLVQVPGFSEGEERT